MANGFRSTTQHYMLVGAYTQPQGKSEGISIYRMDPANSTLMFSHTIPGVNNPSFLAVSGRHSTVYAVGETANGSVNAFAFDADNGTMTFLNRQPSHGDDPCHISLDRQEQFVLVANYTSGSIAVFPILQDGSLGEACAIVQHEGGSVHPTRQQGPHAHWIATTPDNRYAVVADLGLDRLMVYRFDQTNGTLSPNDPPWTDMRSGSGPRQVAFHPGGNYAYVLHELDYTIDACRYDQSSGTFTSLQTVPMLTEAFSGSNSGAAIRVEPSGRYVYASNRGHDSIVIYAIDASGGTLSYVGHASTGGQTPRDFNIDPTGTLLYAANQRSNTIVPFRIDSGSGALEPAADETASPSPVCIVFWYRD